MRILHTSDWHIGRNLHGISLLEAHEAYFDHLVELVHSECIDAVLVSGDVYDRAVPPLESIHLLEDVLLRLTALTRVVVTPGNHDSATRLGFGARMLRGELAIRSQVAGIAHPVPVPDADGGTGLLVYALPYLDPDMTRHELADGGDVPERSHAGVLRAAMGRVEADLRERRDASGARVPAVVMAHAFVSGGEPSDSERDLRVGGVDQVPVAVFGREIDYLALGHLHGPQEVRGRVPARYSGSPVAFSFSERNHTKSSVIVDVSPGGITAETVAAPVVRRLVELSGTLEEILSGRHDAAAGAWVKVTVTDTHRPEHMRERLLERFPHAIVTLHQPAVAAGPVLGVVTEASDPREVLGSFVEEVTGAPPTEGERAELDGAYEAARQGVA